MVQASASCDVLIVGAGPVGQVTALLLADRGLQVAVVERWLLPWPLPRACALDHEALRILQATGVTEALEPRLDKHGGPGRRMGVLDSNHTEIPIGQLRARSDFVWPEHSSFFQPELEALLLQKMAERPNIVINRGWQVEGLSLIDDGVEVQARQGAAGSDGCWQPQGPATSFTAAYVIGADGAGSTVRECLETELHDLGFAYDWLVVDFRPTEPPRWDPHVGQLLDPRRPTTFVTAGPEVRRWEFMLQEGETPEEMNRAEVAWRLLAEWGYDSSKGELVRHAVYRFGGRWATRWRSGRVLLAGDAAHLMPPFLGQGMCSGLRDGIALAWRLDLILRGLAPASLLDTYESERVAHVRQVITEAVRVGELICITDHQAARDRDAQLRASGERAGDGIDIRHGWRLGPGIADHDDRLAGQLGLQGRVRIDGRDGLLDDLLGGQRWQLVSTIGDPAAYLSPEAKLIWTSLSGVLVHVAPEGPVADVDGDYAAWFAAHGVSVALFRPDFYVFGASSRIEDADRLVQRLAEALQLRILDSGVVRA